MTDIDKPEPPAEVWVGVNEGGWPVVGRDTVDAHRYVLAPEGSAVIPPEAVELALAASMNEWRAAWKLVSRYLRAARGGES